MQYVKISLAVLALIGQTSATEKSLSAMASEDDAFSSGKMDESIGVTMDSKELRPENYENA